MSCDDSGARRPRHLWCPAHVSAAVAATVEARPLNGTVVLHCRSNVAERHYT